MEHELLGRISGASGIASFCSCGLAFFGGNVHEADRRFDAHRPTSQPADLSARFTYHPPKDDQPERYEKIRRGGRLLVELLDDLAPDSREKSLAFTHAEQAVMWANAAIARNE